MSELRKIVRITWGEYQNRELYCRRCNVLYADGSADRYYEAITEDPASPDPQPSQDATHIYHACIHNEAEVDFSSDTEADRLFSFARNWIQNKGWERDDVEVHELRGDTKKMMERILHCERTYVIDSQAHP